MSSVILLEVVVVGDKVSVAANSTAEWVSSFDASVDDRHADPFGTLVQLVRDMGKNLFEFVQFVEPVLGRRWFDAGDSVSSVQRQRWAEDWRTKLLPNH